MNKQRNANFGGVPENYFKIHIAIIYINLLIL